MKTFRVPVSLTAVLLAGCAKQPQTVRTPQSTATQRQVANAVYAGEGDYTVKTLRARLDADPRDLDARMELARHFERQGFPGIAIEHLRIAVERAPDSVAAHVALAKLLRAEGNAAEGAKLLTRFTASHEPPVEIWAWLGLLRDDAGDWTGGESAHRNAIALAPNRDDLHNNLGFCLLKQSRRDEAADEFRAALKINPQSATARNNLGLALADAKSDSKEAVLNWQSVSDPASAHNNLAVALIEAGKYENARHEIQIALSYNRQHPAALRNLQLVSRLDGKPAEVTLPGKRETRFAWLRTTWVRLRGGTPPERKENRDSGGAVASRQTGDRITP